MRFPVSPARWLATIVPLIVVGFVAAHVLTVTVAGDLEKHASLIESTTRRSNVMSSIRGDLHRMGMSAGRAERGERFDRETFSGARDDAATRLATLHAIPPCPGEGAAADEVERLMTAAEAKIESSARLIEAGDPRGAHEESSLSLVRAVDGSIERLLQLYAAFIDAEATSVAASHARIRYLASCFQAAAAAFAAILMALAVAAARQHHRMSEERNRLAENRAEELEAFAGRVAHDLRNPLNAIALRVGVGMRRFASNEPVREALEHVSAAVGRMNEMIDGLLDFARAGGRPDPAARADLALVLDRAMVDFIDDAGEAQADLAVEPVASLAVACPAGPLGSVLGNLVRNALKFIVESPPTERRIRVRAQPCGDRVRIEVEDTGPGIPAGMERAIFEPFVRTGTRSQPGLGLGLATVKRIVEAYGGEVFVAPHEGHGSTFVVELPVAAEALPH
jgi:signal transduction histidine kinase